MFPAAWFRCVSQSLVCVSGRAPLLASVLHFDLSSSFLEVSLSLLGIG